LRDFVCNGSNGYRGGKVQPFLAGIWKSLHGVPHISNRQLWKLPMKRFGQPVPKLATKETTDPKAPGNGWKVSEKTLHEIEEIERYIVRRHRANHEY